MYCRCRYVKFDISQSTANNKKDKGGPIFVYLVGYNSYPQYYNFGKKVSNEANVNVPNNEFVGIKVKMKVPSWCN